MKLSTLIFAGFLALYVFSSSPTAHADSAKDPGKSFINTPVNHVGVTVTDIDQAIEFYRDILGFRLIVGPLPLKNDETYFGRLAVDVLSERLTKGQFAHLLGANGVGIELFAFEDDEAGPRKEMEWWKNGFYHLALSARDVDAMISKIEAAGGRRASQTWEIFPDSGRKLAYARDPFGNALEIYSYSYEQTWSLAIGDSASLAALEAHDRPVTLVVELKAKSEHTEEVLALTRNVIPKAIHEPTAEVIELFSDPADPTRILLIEKWGSRAYVTSPAHTEAPHMSSYFEAIMPLLAEPPKWSVWDRTERHLSDSGLAIGIKQ